MPDLHFLLALGASLIGPALVAVHQFRSHGPGAAPAVSPPTAARSTPMTNIVTKIETSIVVGVEDVIAFLQTEVWPDVVAVAKDVTSADLKALLPIATTAVANIAADAANLSNPAVLGQVLASVLEQAATAGVSVITHTTVTTAAIAVSQALQAAAAAQAAPLAPAS